MKQVLYMLTCANDAEAREIAHALVNARQAACVKMLPVSSTFRWEGAVQNTDEVLLLIESFDSQFDAVNETVKMIHSYDQYVLNQVEVTRSNDGVLQWLEGDIT